MSQESEFQLGNAEEEHIQRVPPNEEFSDPEIQTQPLFEARMEFVEEAFAMLDIASKVSLRKPVLPFEESAQIIKQYIRLAPAYSLSPEGRSDKDRYNQIIRRLGVVNAAGKHGRTEMAVKLAAAFAPYNLSKADAILQENNVSEASDEYSEWGRIIGYSLIGMHTTARDIIERRMENISRDHTPLELVTFAHEQRYFGMPDEAEITDSLVAQHVSGDRGMIARYKDGTSTDWLTQVLKEKQQFEKLARRTEHLIAEQRIQNVLVAAETYLQLGDREKGMAFLKDAYQVMETELTSSAGPKVSKPQEHLGKLGMFTIIYEDDPELSLDQVKQHILSVESYDGYNLSELTQFRHEALERIERTRELKELVQENHIGEAVSKLLEWDDYILNDVARVHIKIPVGVPVSVVPLAHTVSEAKNMIDEEDYMKAAELLNQAQTGKRKKKNSAEEALIIADGFGYAANSLLRLEKRHRLEKTAGTVEVGFFQRYSALIHSLEENAHTLSQEELAQHIALLCDGTAALEGQYHPLVVPMLHTAAILSDMLSQESRGDAFTAIGIAAAKNIRGDAVRALCTGNKEYAIYLKTANTGEYSVDKQRISQTYVESLVNGKQDKRARQFVKDVGI